MGVVTDERKKPTQHVPGYLYSRHNILPASSSTSGRTLILICLLVACVQKGGESEEAYKYVQWSEKKGGNKGTYLTEVVLGRQDLEQICA